MKLSRPFSIIISHSVMSKPQNQDIENRKLGKHALHVKNEKILVALPRLMVNSLTILFPSLENKSGHFCFQIL